MCTEQPLEVEEGPNSMTIQTGSSGANNRHRDFKTPTDKQLAALQRYANDPSIPEPIRDGIQMHLSGNRMTYANAWDTIAMIRAAQTSQEATRKKVDKPGIYVDPYTNAYYLVKLSQMNRFYALELVLHNLGEKNEDGTWKKRPEFEWVYEAGHRTVHKISPDWYATPEQMKAWGDITGHCVKCLKELTRQDSIKRGMGLSCWKRQFGE